MLGEGFRARSSDRKSHEYLRARCFAHVDPDGREFAGWGRKTAPRSPSLAVDYRGETGLRSGPGRNCRDDRAGVIAQRRAPRNTLMRFVLVGTVVVLAATAAVLLGGARFDHRTPVIVPSAGGQVPQPRAARLHAGAAPSARLDSSPRRDAKSPIVWRRSKAVGLPNAGLLRRGVQLPAHGRDFFTWDPVTRRVPNRGWRRWGTDRLVRTLVRTLRRYRSANPDAPRVGVGDLSRPRGGDFGARFGSLGHVSHQNGLDADIYYPRTDRRRRPPQRPKLVDRWLAQELVNEFVAAGADLVFVGPSLALKGPSGMVQPLAHHDDHLHVRIR